MHVSDVTMFYTARSGGIRRYLREKRRWLQSHPGFRHSLVLPRAAAAAGECTMEVPSVPLPFSQGYRLPLARTAAVRALAALRPNVIEAGDPYQFAWAALDAGQALGVPVIGFYHSDIPRLVGRVGGAHAARLAESYVRRLYGRFDLVLAPSSCMAQRLRAVGIARVEQQPLGVDTTVFRPALRDEAWRSLLAIGEGERMLVFVGRFASEKNLPVLYSMMDRLGPGYRLVLVGNGGAVPARDDVRVVSYITDPGRLARLVASCDLFVHAGDQETFGLAPLEAMACGLPVVAARAGGLAELVDDEVGRTVPFIDFAALADGMADAVREVCVEERRRTLGDNARRRAEGYDWDRILPDIVGRYIKLGARTTPRLM
ncbi:glycosyltransferase family 1 protein [Azoarcus sp. KH32C]|uniref:glycosyltransferase family 4 protein n=1 Tax=Azoarcus sp. KH32C TaxID=748247 RepID=UPI0002386DBB|nr:glycosyltransferase family 1 protein [Azoarcus sp. KH32C]BAL24943.1 glycosyltransferase family protein [Azoarcus sp. KH32C]